MSKIICDVCGTSYPETASQCPICGCVRSGEPITVAGDTSEAEVQSTTTYTHMKGGRFSKKNVKKRNAGNPLYNAEPTVTIEPKNEKGKKAEKSLVAVVIILLLAIVAVVAYIALRFFDISLPFIGTNPTDPTGDTGVQTQQTTDTTISVIPCENLVISDSVIRFEKVGAAQLLNVKAYPQSQTNDILYSSKDPSVATVDKNGKVTAVGNGQTEITITCGTQSVTCQVVCNVPVETTAPTVTEPVYAEEDLKFADNGYGYEYTISLSEKSYNPYKGSIPVELVEFSSNDTAVATVGEDGLITFVGKGRAVITAKYNDWEISCILYVS